MKDRSCIELYAGGGGLALALSRSGFRHELLIDSEKACIETLQANGFKNAIQSKVEDVDFSIYSGTVDLLAAAPPCQPWSLGGIDKGQIDRRNGWEETIRAVRECMPRSFLFENVGGILRPKFGNYLQSITDRLSGMGYSILIESVNAKEYGIPQNRKRVFIIGFKDADAREKYVSPSKSDKVISVREALSHLGEPDGVNQHVLHGKARSYSGHTGTNPDGPSKTIVAGANGCPGGANTIRQADGSLRYYTIREAATLQTFPQHYRFPDVWTHAFKIIGNAVPIELGFQFASAVAAAL